MTDVLHPPPPEEDEAEGAPSAPPGHDRPADRKDQGRDLLDLSNGAAAPPKENGLDEAAGNDQGDSGPEKRKGEADDKDRPPPKPPSKTVFVVAGLLLLAALGWGGYTHWRTYSASQQTSEQAADRVVEVRTGEAKREDQPVTLTLPGGTEAFDTANIFPRATGYVERRYVDIGSRVKKGDLLVHIAAPDLDQQLKQAEAQLGQTRASKAQAEAQVALSEANVKLATITFNRTTQLTNQGYETLQNRDNQQANVESQQANVSSAKAGVVVADANIKAQQATIDRLQALTAFEDVRAPFDGVVTSRSVDTGDLLNADTSTATPMFVIARDDVIRITVRAPQNDAIGIRDGVDGEVAVPQMPGRVFKGKVTRSSSALLYSSRTLTTEIDVSNPDGALTAGLYVTVTLHIPRESPAVSVPAEALIYNQHGLQVATVENDQARLHPVNVFRDHGTSVELRDGLKGGERIVLSPPALLADGTKVKEHREEDNKKEQDQKAGGSPDRKGSGSPEKTDKQAAASTEGKTPAKSSD